MEGAFRVYLPSNASMDKFPTNTPSEYEVELNPPLNLEGEWQVGVENVCYDSAIAKEDADEEMIVETEWYERQSVNDVYDFSYVLTKDGRWNYDYVPLKVDTFDPNNTKAILNALNSGNALILKDKKKKVYEFTTYKWKNQDYFQFHAFSSGLTIRFDPVLSLHSGFGHAVHVNGTSPNVNGALKEDQ